MRIGSDEWLVSTMEKPLEPQIAICDTHHHLFGKLQLWHEHPDQLYLADDLIQDIDGNKVLWTVFIECQSMWKQSGPVSMRPVGETEYVERIALLGENGKYGKSNVAAGIVGFADFSLGQAIGPVLEAHIAASRSHFRGIRQVVAWDEYISKNRPGGPSRGLLSNPIFRQGVAALQKYQLSLDVWLYFHQLTELAELAAVFPKVQFIVDHLGGPLNTGPYTGKKDEVFGEWQRGITALSEQANVYIKIGGLGLRNAGFGWHEAAKPPTSAEIAEAMSPYFLWCLETFGVNRCMFESDFPVDKISYSYTNIWNAFKRLCKDLSPEEQAALFHDTAMKVYRLHHDH